MPDDLQGIGKANGEKAHVEDKPATGKDVCQHRSFKDEGSRGGQEASDEKLEAGQLQAIRFIDIMINGDDLECPENGTQQNNGIPLLDRQPFVDRQQIKPDYRQYDADPGCFGTLCLRNRPSRGTTTM